LCRRNPQKPFFSWMALEAGSNTWVGGFALARMLFPDPVEDRVEAECPLPAPLRPLEDEALLEPCELPEPPEPPCELETLPDPEEPL